MDSFVKVLSCRVPTKLAVLVKEACTLGGYLNEADFIRSALREKLMREFPELYRHYVAKPATPELAEPENLAKQISSIKCEPKKPERLPEAIPKQEGHKDTEQEDEEVDEELKNEADFKWGTEEEENSEWDEEDDWSEFIVIKEEDEC